MIDGPFTTKEVHTALSESIQHWRNNVIAESPYDASVRRSDCSLCNMFNDHNYTFEDRCHGCPVHADTKMQFCNMTPFEDAVVALTKWHDEYDEYGLEKDLARDVWRNAARAELNFLISLLPERQPK